MMLDFRPVDCFTQQPFSNFVPAFLNETIYGDRVETGWSYNVYTSDANQFAIPVSRLLAPPPPPSQRWAHRGTLLTLASCPADVV